MSKYVEAVKKYAMDHYDEKSWSYLIEAFDDLEIARMIAGATSDRMAIYKASKWVDMHFSYAEDIRNS